MTLTSLQILLVALFCGGVLGVLTPSEALGEPPFQLEVKAGPGHTPLPVAKLRPNYNKPPSEATRIPVAAIKASSELPPWKNYTFGAENLIDGRLDTSWQPAKNKTYGVGQWVELDLGGTFNISHVILDLGLQKVDPKLGDLFCRNNRPSEYIILLDDGTNASGSGSESLSYAISDTFCDGERSDPDTVCGKTAARRLRIIITRVLEPVVWDDVAIAEIRVYGTPTPPLPADGDPIAWNRPGSWPFRTALADFCVTDPISYRTRDCGADTKQLMQGWQPWRGTPAPPIPRVDLEGGTYIYRSPPKPHKSFASKPFEIAFERGGDGVWRATRRTPAASTWIPDEFFSKDILGCNPCWEKLKKKRPYEILEPDFGNCESGHEDPEDHGTDD